MKKSCNYIINCGSSPSGSAGICLGMQHKLVKDLNLEKEDLTTELVALQNDYATLTSTNQAINDSLAVEREKVGQLIERLQKTEATN